MTTCLDVWNKRFAVESFFADKAFLNVTGSTSSNEAAFIFEFEDGGIGFGLFTGGGYTVKYSGGSSGGAGGASHATVDDVIRVYFEENYNSLLDDVIPALDKKFLFLFSLM